MLGQVKFHSVILKYVEGLIFSRYYLGQYFCKILQFKQRTLTDSVIYISRYIGLVNNIGLYIMLAG